MINVYLDDLRPCPPGFVLARTAEECMLLLQDCEINILSLDHDLGLDQPTGFDVVKFMVQHGRYANDIYLHTSSAMGKSNMFQLLYKHKPAHVKVHLFPMPPEILAVAAKQSKSSS